MFVTSKTFFMKKWTNLWGSWKRVHLEIKIFSCLTVLRNHLNLFTFYLFKANSRCVLLSQVYLLTSSPTYLHFPRLSHTFWKSDFLNSVSCQFLIEKLVLIKIIWWWLLNEIEYSKKLALEEGGGKDGRHQDYMILLLYFSPFWLNHAPISSSTLKPSWVKLS